MSREKWIIVDVDGTLADTEHRVHFLHESPRNWEGWHGAAEDDKPIRATVDLVYTLQQCGYYIAIMTGRSNEFRKDTQEWLADHGIYADCLCMRDVGDRRKDSVIKKEWFADSYFADNIEFVLEDRTRVVEMWRSLGLTVFQVAEGNF